MADLVRDATFGQIIRFLTRNRYLQYPEEKPDFQLPPSYRNDAESLSSGPEDEVKEKEEVVEEPEPAHLAKTSSNTVGERTVPTDLERQLTQASLKNEESKPIEPIKTSDGVILVDYYSTDDPANPQNWSLKKKALIGAQIGLYTTGVYMGSSIYSASEQGVVERFGVSIEASELGLALFVLGYAFGPMVWSPLSEWPIIGRNPPYIATFGLFVILCVPTALVENFAGLLVLRFLQGLFGSPALATGAASLADVFPFLQFSYVLSCWAFFGVCGPALGPLISGFSVAAENWRWSLWEMLWLSAPIFLLLFFLLPETYAPNILLRRAKRIRARTGQQHFKSQSEIDQEGMTVRQTAYDVLVKPFQLNFQDPAIAFTSVYVALCYGIYYSFFEVFPFVYVDMYHFNEGQTGLAFLSIMVGCGTSLLVYWWYLARWVNPEIIRTGEMGVPERRLIPSLYASILLPIGLFIFAWTARPDVHWIGTMIGLVLFSFGIFIVIQCLFIYLPMVYPQYAASLFAGNDFARSSLAVGAVQFSRPMFINLGVGSGVSLLAALCAVCVVGVFALWWFGATLRAKSRFSAKPSK